ncbi:MAG: DUF502 domain-containing protein [Ignavibacteria bacterium]|jgi:uncharacterized membrane protein|nr:DUF502 domain-containing protein [Ignavibacteria bacterium]
MQEAKKILLEGFKVMFPLLLGVFVFQKLFELFSGLLKPIIDILPETPYFGHIIDLRAVLIFLILVFLFGLFGRSETGKYNLRKLTSYVMRIVPGYSVFDNLIREESKIKGKKNSSVVFATLDDAWIMGIVIEEKNEQGHILVYIPSAPIPTGGSLYMFTEEQVRRVDITVNEAMKFIWHLGKDSDKILKGKVNW